MFFSHFPETIGLTHIKQNYAELHHTAWTDALFASRDPTALHYEEVCPLTAGPEKSGQALPSLFYQPVNVFIIDYVFHFIKSRRSIYHKYRHRFI